jgi:hypothetical protein
MRIRDIRQEIALFDYLVDIPTILRRALARLGGGNEAALHG